MKRAFSLILALAMVLCMGIPAFAAPVEGDLTQLNGSIVVNTVDPQAKIDLYRIFDLASFSYDSEGDPKAGNYVYRLRQPCTHQSVAEINHDQDAAKVAAWQAFAQRTDILEKYISISTATAVEGVNHEYIKAKGADFEGFAAEAKKYVDANATLLPDYTIDFAEELKEGGKATTHTSGGIKYYQVTITSLHYGYYYLDSTTGALASLNTTNPTVIINDKNNPPYVVKQVQEDSTGEEYRTANNADINQRVHFRSTITVRQGRTNITYHDKMGDALDFVNGSVKVYKGTELVPAEKYTVTSFVGEDAAPSAHGCDFEVKFKDTYIAGLENNATLYVEYDADLNENAVVGNIYNIDGNKETIADGVNLENFAPNKNSGALEYGEGHWTEWDDTYTETYEFNVYKHYTKDSFTHALKDAKFVVYRGSGDARVYAKFGSKIEGLPAVGDTPATYDTYQNVEWVQVTTDPKTPKEWEDAGVTVITTDESGMFKVRGLDADRYFLHEVEAPAGYERIDDVRIEISNFSMIETSQTMANGAVQVPNNPGTLLPTTGGTGTTIMYIVGSALLIGAVVIFVTKRRMNMD